jgi:hypothetical protein
MMMRLAMVLAGAGVALAVPEARRLQWGGAGYGGDGPVVDPLPNIPLRPEEPMEGPAVGPNAGPCAQELASTPAMPGAPTPTCDEQGGYMPVQCHGSVGDCWCADEDGTEIEGTHAMCRGSCSVTPESCIAARGASGNTLPHLPNGGGLVVPAPGGDAVGTVGARCADGFCDDPSNCPQCAAGLFCNVPKGMMCAGTCYGTCAKPGH